jgi:hypothetical protein
MSIHTKYTPGLPSTSNLIFHIDAQDPGSFVTGSGSPDSMWKELSGNAQAGSLVSVLHDGANLKFNGTESVCLMAVSRWGRLSTIFDAGATISAWVRAESDGEGDNGRIVDKAGWAFTVGNESAGEVDIKFSMSHATNNGNWNSSPASNEFLTNEWTHIALSFTAIPVNNEDPIMYINGESVTTNENDTPSGAYSGDSTNDIRIGNNSGGDRTFDGDIAVVKIWDKVLTAEEVLAEFKHSRERFGI